MKTKHLLITLALGSTLLLPICGKSQNRDTMSKSEIITMDSIELASAKVQAQETADVDRLADAKLDRKQTRAKLKEARRVENDANTAARESRGAVRAEKKAQKARKDATRQEKRATDARNKSDKN